MNPANRSRFVYVTYIRTTPGQLWQALTDPQRIRQYRFDTTVACDWEKGSAWKMTHPDRGVLDTGERRSIRRGEGSSAGKTNGSPRSRPKAPAAARSSWSRRTTP